MSSGQSTGGSDATNGVPRLSPGSPFVVMPDPGLRLVRRWARWSTARRRVLATALSSCALAAAFPPVQDLSKWWIFWPALCAWSVSIGRLFIPWERITGMWRVRREVWLRRATESAGGWIVVLDGREIRSRFVEVFCCESLMGEGGRGPPIPTGTVALKLDDDLYEIQRSLGVESALSLSRVLAYEIDGTASKVRQPRPGPEMWRPEYLSALDAGFVPLMAKFIGFGSMSLGANDLRFFLVGALAIAVRVALVGERLANATARQLDRDFAKDFGGARPARPVLWLKPEPVRRVLFWSRWLMYGAAVSVLLHC